MKSYYQAFQGGIGVKFPWKSKWKVRVPTKVFFFVWTAVQCKILIVDNVQKHNSIIVDWCRMCERSEETSHIL